jgi:DNA-binding CsgD family transcriptional regulator
MKADSWQPGLIVLDGSFKLIAYNSEAVRILSFPNRARKLKSIEVLVEDIIGAADSRKRQMDNNATSWEIRSGKRTYLARTLNLTKPWDSRRPEPAQLVIVDRRPPRGINMVQVARRFGLTERERESVALLLQGLTSKEIATRMKISPNTVKAFLHLVMLKTGVNTRSGILGKLLVPAAADASAKASRGFAQV